MIKVLKINRNRDTKQITYAIRRLSVGAVGGQKKILLEKLKEAC